MRSVSIYMEELTLPHKPGNHSAATRRFEELHVVPRLTRLSRIRVERWFPQRRTKVRTR